MRLSARFVAIGTVVFVLGSILLFMALGLWKTESTKIPATIKDGQFAGAYDPADIRGSYTFADIEASFAVTAVDLAKAFALDTTSIPAASYMAKDLETVYAQVDDGAGEVGTDSLRWFVSLYLGMPYVPEDTTYLPNPALNLLKEAGKIDETLFQQLKAKSVAPSSENPGISDEHPESTDSRVIKGNTMYGDLLDWGLTEQHIEEVLGFPMGARSETIRDHITGEGLEFSAYKGALQELVDAL